MRGPQPHTSPEGGSRPAPPSLVSGRIVPVVLPEALALAALICLDPGHATDPAVGRGVEPIGPGSRTLKIRDAGGAPGEAEVVLAIARTTRTLLVRRGYR